VAEADGDGAGREAGEVGGAFEGNRAGVAGVPDERAIADVSDPGTVGGELDVLDEIAGDELIGLSGRAWMCWAEGMWGAGRPGGSWGGR